MESKTRLTPETSISADPQPTEGPEALTTCSSGRRGLHPFAAEFPGQFFGSFRRRTSLRPQDDVSPFGRPYPGRMRRWLCEHETWVDALLAATFVVVALFVARTIKVGTGQVGDGARPPNGWTDLLLVLVLAPIALRRRFPVAAYLVTAAAALGL